MEIVSGELIDGNMNKENNEQCFAVVLTKVRFAVCRNWA